MAALDPTRIRNADPVPGAWKFTKINKQILFPAFQNVFCILVGIIFDLLPTLSIPYFICKNSPFVTLKFNQDSEPHGSTPWISESGFRFGSAWRQKAGSGSNADPQHCIDTVPHTYKVDYNTYRTLLPVTHNP